LPLPSSDDWADVPAKPAAPPLKAKVAEDSGWEDVPAPNAAPPAPQKLPPVPSTFDRSANEFLLGAASGASGLPETMHPLKDAIKGAGQMPPLDESIGESIFPGYGAAKGIYRAGKELLSPRGEHEDPDDAAIRRAHGAGSIVGQGSTAMLGEASEEGGTLAAKVARTEGGAGPIRPGASKLARVGGAYLGYKAGGGYPEAVAGGYMGPSLLDMVTPRRTAPSLIESVKASSAPPEAINQAGAVASGGGEHPVTRIPIRETPFTNPLTPEQVPGKPQLREIAAKGDPRAGQELQRRGETILYTPEEGNTRGGSLLEKVQQSGQPKTPRGRPVNPIDTWEGEGGGTGVTPPPPKAAPATAPAPVPPRAGDSETGGRTLYHVTDRANVDSIMKTGLEPRVAEAGGHSKPGVFLSDKPGDASWHPTAPENSVTLKVQIPEGTKVVRDSNNPGRWKVARGIIPPENISVHGDVNPKTFLTGERRGSVRDIGTEDPMRTNRMNDIRKRLAEPGLSLRDKTVLQHQLDDMKANPFDRTNPKEVDIKAAKVKNAPKMSREEATAASEKRKAGRSKRFGGEPVPEEGLSEGQGGGIMGEEGTPMAEKSDNPKLSDLVKGSVDKQMRLAAKRGSDPVSGGPLYKMLDAIPKPTMPHQEVMIRHGLEQLNEGGLFWGKPGGREVAPNIKHIQFGASGKWQAVGYTREGELRPIATGSDPASLEKVLKNGIPKNKAKDIFR
jgi:hypothetical protein